MTDPHDLSPEDETDALAAEYVLGVLALDERLAAQARLKSDDDFAARVSRWEARLDPLNDAYAAVAAPDLMPRIEARLFGQPAAQRRNWWGFITGAAVAAALSVVVLLYLPPAGQSGPALTASLAADAQELAFNASYSDGTLTLARLSGTGAGEGHDYELWVIVGDAAPKSLGIVKGATTSRQLDSLAPGAVLAITLEPAGGSPNGEPTGAVLVSGVIVSS